jgi:hypothetical protein
VRVKLFVTTLFLLGSVTSRVAGGSSGSIAGNGGGLAEKNMLFAYLNLDRFIDLCLQGATCQMTDGETKILSQIKASLPQERLNPDMISFVPANRPPDFFRVDGLLRVAKTGDHVGDAIFINSALLYNSNNGDAKSTSDEGVRVMDIPLAASVLIHEFGHHHGVNDHYQLDLLGTKLQNFLIKDSERSEFWNNNAALVTVQLNDVHSDEAKKKLFALDELILENRNDLYPLNADVLRAMTCSSAAGIKKPVGLRIYNLHGERGTVFDEKSHLITKPFRAWYIMSCADGKETEHGDLKMTLTFKKVDVERFVFLPEKTLIQPLSCAKHPEVCK